MILKCLEQLHILTLIHLQEPECLNMFGLETKMNASDDSRWHASMNGPDISGYLEATKAEIATLTKLQAWTVVSSTTDMKILDST